MNNTNLIYHGKVELIKFSKSKKCLGKIVLNNAGENPLFEMFAKSLVGIYQNTYIPTSVSVDYVDSNSNRMVLQSNPITGLVYVYSSNVVQQPHTKLTAYIPFNQRIKSIYDTSPIEGKVLISLNSGQTKLASIDITNSPGIKDMTPGQSFILNWYLYISNEQSTEQNEQSQEEAESSSNVENNSEQSDPEEPTESLE